VQLILAAADSKDDLQRELSVEIAARPRELQPGLFACDSLAEPGARLPYLVFARQVLPDAVSLSCGSIRAWAAAVADAIVGVLPDHQPWSLHVFPFTEMTSTTRMGARAWHTRARAGSAEAPPREPSPRPGVGHNRCRLIEAAVRELLQKRRRHLLRYLRPGAGAFGPDEALVQLLLSTPEAGFLSVVQAPFPFEQRHALSSLAGGQMELACDKQAPSRAFAKLLEAEARMNHRIQARETCVDLGAAPGSWTYVAARRGARVTAVDRSELRVDLMQQRHVRFERGDAFRFEPDAPVDWLLCDVIAAAERSAELLRRWLQNGWCRHFVVTLKLDDAGSGDVLVRLKQQLPELASELWLMRLCANKKEACAFGTA
jgi:23S rRNA (cytidine2498-2'-O)-methyltransferase